MPFVEAAVMQARQEELYCALFLLREILVRFPLQPLTLHQRFLERIDETMGWENVEGCERLQACLRRMRKFSQEAVLPEAILKELQEVQTAYEKLMDWFHLSVQTELLGIVS